MPTRATGSRPPRTPTAAIAAVADGRIDAALVVERTDTGSLDFRFHTRGSAASAETQLVGFGGARGGDPRLAVGPAPTTPTNVFHPPAFEVAADERADRRRPADRPDRRPPAARSSASSSSCCIFITVVIYGMWVATGVAAEKSSRVMELMISAASPVQLLVGKVRRARARRADPVRGDPRAGRASSSCSRIASPCSPSGRTGAAEPLVGLTVPLLGAFLRLLPARLRALRAHLRGGGLARQPPRRPPDAVACR